MPTIPAAGIQVSGFRLLTVYRVSGDGTYHDSLGRDLLNAWVLRCRAVHRCCGKQAWQPKRYLMDGMIWPLRSRTTLELWSAESVKSRLTLNALR